MDRRCSYSVSPRAHSRCSYPQSGGTSKEYGASPRGSRALCPLSTPRPSLRTHTRERSPQNAWLKNSGVHVLENYRAIGNGEPVFKRLVHSLAHPQDQCKCSSLKITQTLYEGDLLTHLKVSAGHAGTCWDSCQGHHFLVLFLPY